MGLFRRRGFLKVKYHECRSLLVYRPQELLLPGEEPWYYTHKAHNKPGKAISKTTLQGSRHAIKAIKNTLVQGGYRKDLADGAVRRACAIIRSQNTSAVKKRRSRRKKN